MLKNAYDFVIDCSVTMAWFFEDEKSDFTARVLEKLASAKAIVPTIWPLEIANVLLIAKRNKRITETESASFIDALTALPITIDHTTSSKAMHSIFVLAGENNLTVYDGAYLELALREKIPLLTLDKELIKAAKKLHIPLDFTS